MKVLHESSLYFLPADCQDLHANLLPWQLLQFAEGLISWKIIGLDFITDGELLLEPGQPSDIAV